MASKDNQDFNEDTGFNFESSGKQANSKKSSSTGKAKRKRVSTESPKFYDRPGSFQYSEENYNENDYRSREREKFGHTERHGNEWYGQHHGYDQFEHRHYSPRNPRKKSLNFERYAEEGNRFVNEVAEQLEIWDRDKAARIMRAVLHAIRDRLPADDAVQFAQGMPMALKGIMMDQYDISATPVIIRSKYDFIDFIVEKNCFTAAEDFPYPEDVVKGLRAVFRVLKYHMDPGQVNHIKRLLPGDIVNMIDS